MILFLCSNLYAQSEQQVLATFLGKRGFDHVVIRTSRNLVAVMYENFGYRNEVLAAKMVAAGMALTFGHKQLLMAPQYAGVLMVLLQNDRETLASLQIHGRTMQIPQFRVADSHVQQQWKAYAFKPLFHSRFEIILHPEMKALFGNYQDPLRTQVSIVPEFRISVLPGIQLSSHLVVPVYDDLTNSNIHPGPIWLTHLKHIRQTFLFYTAGLLQNDRYGIQFGSHSFLNSFMAVSTRIGYSGSTLWSNKKLYLSSMQDLTFNIKLVYFNKAFQFFAGIAFHQFIDGQNGWRLDFYRYFHELRAGFWGMTIQGEMNGGFHVAIPLPPFKYRSTKRLRVRSANYFRWEYRAAALNGKGQPLKANIYLDDQFDRYTPAYLNARL